MPLHKKRTFVYYLKSGHKILIKGLIVRDKVPDDKLEEIEPKRNQMQIHGETK